MGPPASARLFTLAGGLEQMRIDVQVAEGDVGRVTRGQTAEVKGPGGDDRPAFAGRVEDVRLTPSAEHGAVFYTVVVGVAQRARRRHARLATAAGHDRQRRHSVARP